MCWHQNGRNKRHHAAAHRHNNVRWLSQIMFEYCLNNVQDAVLIRKFARRGSFWRDHILNSRFGRFKRRQPSSNTKSKSNLSKFYSGRSASPLFWRLLTLPSSTSLAISESFPNVTIISEITTSHDFPWDNCTFSQSERNELICKVEVRLCSAVVPSCSGGSNTSSVFGKCENRDVSRNTCCRAILRSFESRLDSKLESIRHSECWTKGKSTIYHDKSILEAAWDPSESVSGAS